MNDYRRALERVQMMDFALHEAALFLDNHTQDKEALEYFNYYQKLAAEARTGFVNQFGPLVYGDQKNIGYWQWAQGPWPWEYEV